MDTLFSSQLFSVIAGAMLTLVVSLIVNKNNISNSLDEEIAKEKINAYKSIYNCICKLNHTISPVERIKLPAECYWAYIRVGTEKYRRSYHFPTVFLSFYDFCKYKQELSNILNINRIFLDQELINKVSFLDQYLGEIFFLTINKPDEYLQVVGFLLENEISVLRDEIESDIQLFFNYNKRKKIQSHMESAYGYGYKKIKETELNDWFLGSNRLIVGSDDKCMCCKSKDKCPLKLLVNEADAKFKMEEISNEA